MSELPPETPEQKSRLERLLGGMTRPVDKVSDDDGSRDRHEETIRRLRREEAEKRASETTELLKGVNEQESRWGGMPVGARPVPENRARPVPSIYESPERPERGVTRGLIRGHER